jgi:hypothetical protein
MADYTIQNADDPNTYDETPTGDTAVTTPYDRLQEILSQEVENEPITLEVPNRPGVTIKFDTNIRSEDIDFWRKQSTTRADRRRGGGDAVDSVKFAALVVYNKAECFLVDGEEVILPNGEELSFVHQDTLKQIFGIVAATPMELVKKVYASDAHVLAAGGQIVEAAGYGEELAEVNTPN